VHWHRNSSSEIAAPWPPVNIRVSGEIRREIHVAAIKLGLTMGEYMTQLFASGKAHGFPGRTKLIETLPRPKRRNFLIRMPPKVARDMKVAAAVNNLKLGDYAEQLFAYAKRYRFPAKFE
jgi:hypothetical protein